MKIIRVIHTVYGMFGFILFFALLFPFLLIPIVFPGQYALTGIINRWWARCTLLFCFLPYSVESRGDLDTKKKYIFCPNHFSYLDIPTMGLNPVNAIFVGKNDMMRIPLFGFMYRKLHITVDRSRLKSKYDTLLKSRQAIDEGKSLVIYPEGGIFTTQPPEMVRFKDGAFRLAIEKQIPVVPVTIPNNWIILPPDEFLVRWGKVRVIIHEPIDTSQMTLADLPQLKNRVFQTIDEELKRYASRTGLVG